MSGDTLSSPAAPPIKEKKSKKSKHHSTDGSAAAVEDSTKPKSEKRKKEKGDDDVVDEEDKRERKKKKKERKAAAAAAAAMDVDDSPVTAEVPAPADAEQTHKKKKRKHDDAPAEETVDASATKKDKKKKQKLESDPSSSTPTEVPTAVDESSKSSKKDKKNKRKLETDPSPSAPSTSTPVISTNATAAPSPSDVTAFLTKHSITLHTPDDEPAPTPVISFDQLAVPPSLRAAFAGFKEPTPIQACTWPPALEGRDVVGVAETGSGKTLAFGIPALARLIASPISANPQKAKATTTVSILVVAPTRELAIQTHDTLSALGAPFGIASVAIFGGVDKGGQIRTLQNANKDGKTTRIIVGTPGRILDLMNDGACDLSRVDYLVLDEADRMLDSGFENDIRAIISNTKQGSERQTMMFSATWPEAVRRLASSFQQRPIRVTVGSDDLTANSRVEQIVEVFDDGRTKDSRLLDRLRQLAHKKTTKTGSDEARILVFALYKKEASRVEQMLRRQGYSVGALHGDKSQSARMEALEAFKNGTTGLLVATDVAARGLDIPNVGAVINYTFPLTIEDYIHRIGRTGRGGRTGKSITFFTGADHERSLAGELARVLGDSGFKCEGLQKFPMTIKKKTHGAYGAFFRDDIPVPKGPTKIKF